MSEQVKVHIISTAMIGQEEIHIVKTRFPKRYKKAEALSNHDDFLRSIGASYLLTQAFSKIEEDEIMYNEHGKPYCVDRYFSIAHEGGYAVLAVADSPVGVDICAQNRNNAEVGMKVFTQDEQFLCSKFTGMFAKLWSQKEAVVKLIGEGLSRDLKSFSVSSFDRDRPIMLDEKSIYCKTVDFNAYYISVCSFNDISIKVLTL